MSQVITPPSHDPIYLCVLGEIFASPKSDLIEKAFEFAHEAIIVLDSNNNIVLANSSVSEIYGIETPRGKKCWEIFQSGLDSCDRPPEQCWLKKIFETGQSIKTITSQTLKNGDTKQVAISASPILDTENNIGNVVVLLRDVTSELECHELKEDFIEQKYLYEQAPEGLFTITAEGTITKVNDRWLKLFGYTRDEAVNRLNMCDLTAQDQKTLCSQTLGSLMDGVKVQCAEMEWARKDGSTFWSRARALPITEPSNNSSIAIISLRDIADSIEEEEMLGQSTRFTRALLDSMGEGVLIMDTNFRVVETNRKFLEITQQQADEVLGQHCYKISHDSDIPCWEIENGEHDCPTKIALETGETASAIHIHKDAKNQNHYIELKAFPLKDDNGNVFQVIETHTDITETKNLQDRLHQAEKMEAIGTMAGGIAHDFNNILTPIIGNAELALAEMSQEDSLYDELNEIKSAAQRAAELIRHILAFSRRQILEKKVVNLSDVVLNLSKMLKRVIRENVILETDLADDLWNISADPTQLEQIIVNLSVNARDAMPNGGKILIETKNVQNLDTICHTCGEPLSGSYIVLMISDNGTGIDAETMGHIFDPFFTTKKQGQGTGMGLSTVLGIMHQHGGHVNLYSEIGLGTTFKVYFPLYEPTDENTAIDGGVRHEEEKNLNGTETILLVDDDHSVQRMLSRIMSKFGYKVLTASDGDEALNIFKQNRDDIDLVLTDIVMPRMGGRVLMEEIQAIRPDMPTLFMSGYSLNAVHHKYILDKGIEYIQKPPAMEDLLTKVRTILDTAKDSAAGSTTKK